MKNNGMKAMLFEDFVKLENPVKYDIVTSNDSKVEICAINGKKKGLLKVVSIGTFNDDYFSLKI